MPQLPENNRYIHFSDIITANRIRDYIENTTGVIERNYNRLMHEIYLNCEGFLQDTREVPHFLNIHTIYSPREFIYLFGYSYFKENYTLNKNVLESEITKHIRCTGIPFVRFCSQDYDYVINYPDFIQYHRSPELYELNHTFANEDIPIVAYMSLFGGIALTITDSNFVFRKTHTRCIVYSTPSLDIVEEAKRLNNHIVREKYK